MKKKSISNVSLFKNEKKKVKERNMITTLEKERNESNQSSGEEKGNFHQQCLEHTLCKESGCV